MEEHRARMVASDELFMKMRNPDVAKQIVFQNPPMELLHALRGMEKNWWYILLACMTDRMRVVRMRNLSNPSDSMKVIIVEGKQRIYSLLQEGYSIQFHNNRWIR